MDGLVFGYFKIPANSGFIFSLYVSAYYSMVKALIWCPDMSFVLSSVW